MSRDRQLPVLSADGERRQARLQDARLAIVADTRRGTADLEAYLDACAGASADLLLLRDKTADEQQLRAAAAVFRAVADRHGSLFVLNDLPGLAAAVGADGVHVGQHDVHPDHARRVCGPDLLIGRTVDDERQLQVCGDEDVDYLAAPAGLVAVAARHASHPWFAVTGPGPAADAALSAGARRVVVTDVAPGPPGAAEATWELRRALAASHRPSG